MYKKYTFVIQNIHLEVQAVYEIKIFFLPQNSNWYSHQYSQSLRFSYLWIKRRARCLLITIKELPVLQPGNLRDTLVNGRSP